MSLWSSHHWFSLQEPYPRIRVDIGQLKHSSKKKDVQRHSEEFKLMEMTTEWLLWGLDEYHWGHHTNEGCVDPSDLRRSAKNPRPRTVCLGKTECCGRSSSRHDRALGQCSVSAVLDAGEQKTHHGVNRIAEIDCLSKCRNDCPRDRPS